MNNFQKSLKNCKYQHVDAASDAPHLTDRTLKNLAENKRIKKC